MKGLRGLHVDLANIPFYLKKNLRLAFYRTPMFVGPTCEIHVDPK